MQVLYYAPCNQPASICPWRQGRRSSRRSRAERRQPHPKRKRKRDINKSVPRSCVVQSWDTITYNSEVLEGTGGLNVLEGLLETAELGLNLALGLLSALDGLGLESIDGLQLAADIVGGGLEVLEVVLDLVDDGLVLQDLAVVLEVDSLGLLRQDLNLAARIVVTLLEGLEGSSGLAAESEGAGQLGPVDLESGATLYTKQLADTYLSPSETIL